jgi:hypothetical protein
MLDGMGDSNPVEDLVATSEAQMQPAPSGQPEELASAGSRVVLRAGN